MSKGQNPPGIERRRFRPYPRYKDSGVKWLATVPASWRICAVKHRFDIFLGKMLQPEPASAHDLQVPYLKAANVQWENIGFSSLQTMWASKDEIQTGQVAMGDLLVCEGGEVGRAAILTQKPEEPTIIQNALHRVRSQSEMPKFLMYLIEVSASGGWLEVECNKATIQHFTRDKFGSLRIALPSLDEQCRIVSFLDRETAKIDALIEKNERLIELLHEKRTALITQTVTKGLDPTVPMKDSGVEWLGEIPAHWEVKRLRHVGSAIIGLTYEPGDVVGPDEGMLVLRASNVYDGHIVLDDNVFVKRLVRDCLVTREGDILICSRSGSRNLIGKSAKIDKTVMGLTFGAFMTVFRSVCNDYLFYAFNSTLFNYQSGAFLTSTINQLTLGNLNSFTIPVPPSIEQIEITAFLDCEIAKIDALASRIREVIAHLREYRVALVSAAVTGKIDIRTEPVEARNAR